MDTSGLLCVNRLVLHADMTSLMLAGLNCASTVWQDFLYHAGNTL